MGVTHDGDNFPNSGHHHLLIDVNEPLNPDEPIAQDKSHLHFGAGQNRGTDRTSAGQAHPSTRVGRRQASPVQAARRVRQNYHDHQVRPPRRVLLSPPSRRASPNPSSSSPKTPLRFIAESMEVLQSIK